MKLMRVVPIVTALLLAGCGGSQSETSGATGNGTGMMSDSASMGGAMQGSSGSSAGMRDSSAMGGGMGDSTGMSRGNGAR